MGAPLTGFGPMAWSPLGSGGGSSTPPVVNTTTTTFEGGPWTFTKDATGAYEDVITFSVADDATSFFRLRNSALSGGQFGADLYCLADNALPALSLSLQTNQDTGAQPVMGITLYPAGTTRPLYQILKNGGTPLVDIDGLGTWTYVKPAETGVSEDIAKWGVDDSALRLTLKNLHTADTEFVPCFIWPNNGAGAPTFTTRSTGARLVLRDTLAADAVDHAIGYTTDTVTYSVGKATAAYKHAFYAGETEVVTIRGNGVLDVLKPASVSTLGDSRYLKLSDSAGSLNGRTEVGFGYPGATFQPVVVGFQTTSNTGNTKGNIYLATRDVTTDTAPTVRVEVVASGEVGVGKTPTAGVLLDVNGPIGFKSYTVATLPSAAVQAGQGVYVSDASGSPCLAISNGTNWKRCDDMTVTVS